MKQFLIFLFTGASIAILDLVDSAFGNQISLDSICVMSAFTVLYWCFSALCTVGEYAYRVKLKYESECFTLQVTITLICSFIPLHGECYHLVITTGIADAITVIYYLIFCRFKWSKPTFKRLKECIKCARDIVIDRVLGKVATIGFNICASHLSTDMYALHSIGYAIATSLEECTNSCYTYQIIKLKIIYNLKDKYEMCKKISKQIFIPTVLVCYVIAILMVFPMKGIVSFKSALLITLLYNSQCILLQLYENHRGFLTSCEATECLRLGGLFGIFVRIPIAIISIVTPIGIYGFALGSGIDFFIRGLYYRHKSIQLVNNSNIIKVKVK